MDLSPVGKFIVDEAGKTVKELVNPREDIVQFAHDLYVTHHGQLPTAASLEPLQPSEKFQIFVRDFSTGMRSFLTESKDKEALEKYTGCSWEDLRKEGDEARQAYKKQEERRHNWRHPFEVLDNAGEVVVSPLEFLLELIPDGEYTSIISGSLRLAYYTAKRKQEIRAQILELLDGLDDRTWPIKAKIELYSRTPEVRTKSEDLYMAILNAVRYCTKYLNKQSTRETFKAFFQQSRYEAKFENVLEDIRQNAKAFQDIVEVCSMRQLDAIHKAVTWQNHPIIATYFLLAGFVKDFPYLIQQALAEERLKRPYDNPPVQTFVQPAPVQVTMWISAQQLLELLLSTGGQSRSPITAQELLISFENDARTAIYQHLSQPSEAQIGLLMSDTRMTTWLKSLSSQLIIVHDEISPQGSPAVSNLSYLCALMSKMLRSPGMWPLTFFCGLHSMVGTNYQGGKGIMRSLTLQLLMAFGDAVFPVPIHPDIIARGLASDDLETICTVFSILLRNLPVGVVYCMIDGAHWYDTEYLRDETQTVVRYLHGLVAKATIEGTSPALKVLVTTPTPRQRYLWGMNVEDIYLEQHLLTGGHQWIGTGI